MSFPSISTKEKWFWHTNTADRFRFSLHSVFLLAPFANESFAADFALWNVHVRFVQLLAQHTITTSATQSTSDLARSVQI